MFRLLISLVYLSLSPGGLDFSPPEPSSCFWMLPFLHHLLSHLPATLPATLRARPRPTNTPTPPRLAAQRPPGVAPHTPCPTPAIGCGVSAPGEGSEIVRVDTKCDLQKMCASMAMGFRRRGDAPADRARGVPTAERSCPSGSIESLRPRDPRVFSLKLPTWSPRWERVRLRADCLRADCLRRWERVRPRANCLRLRAVCSRREAERGCG